MSLDGQNPTGRGDHPINPLPMEKQNVIACPESMNSVHVSITKRVDLHSNWDLGWGQPEQGHNDPAFADDGMRPYRDQPRVCVLLYIQ